MKTHREYIAEQSKKSPTFAEHLAGAEREVAIAVALAQASRDKVLFAQRDHYVAFFRWLCKPGGSWY